MNNLNFTKEQFKQRVIYDLRTFARKTVEQASPEEIYQATVFAIRDVVNDIWMKTHDTYYEKDVKIVYYLSMEFLMGRFFGNSIMNLSIYEPIKEAFDELGIDYRVIEEMEPAPALGNGGLGRLAACFLDSLSTMNLPAYGCGIRYRYGIFKQSIENGNQIEKPDNWLENGNPWGLKRSEYSVEVKFGGHVKAVLKENGEYKFVQEGCHSIIAVPYDYPVIGYNTNFVNTLRLWEAKAKSEINLKQFNEGEHQKALEEQNMARIITEVLYPADDNYSGKELRLRQQYFFISATIQRVIQKFKKHHGNDFSLLPDRAAFQLNDTHPSMAVAELMRVLIDENDLSWDDAWDITQKVCGYTNHTIMSEALEKWPMELFSRLLPRIYQIVEEINRRFCLEIIQKYGNDSNKIRKIAIIADGQIRMAHLAIVGSHSVNGVAELHTKILKNQELKDFYEIYPEKFNNKTNGITQRRWLLYANRRLSKLITKKIGDDWVTDLYELKKLKNYENDNDFLNELMEVKMQNKKDLADYIKRTKGIEVDPNSIFDIQVKRFHEYKRQLLNILRIIYLYNTLKIYPELDIVPRTYIFGGKSAASYAMAKLIIKLINSVADVINNDEQINNKIKVVFLEDYRVSLAEKLMPAADVSEQISTASKEASGTGNMKFMLNGALTIGTLDGANIEILEEVGEENIFIFGLKAEEVIEKYKNNSYDPWEIYNLNQGIRMALTSLINGTFDSNTELFRNIYESLLNGINGSRADEYFILADFEEYCKAHERIDKAYSDKKLWAQMSLRNIASSGKFSSDRTIKEYADEIWNIKPVTVEV